MIREEFLNLIPVYESLVHFVQSEFEIDLAVSAYRQNLLNTQLFDLTILGIGEEGHVASIFPGNDLGAAFDSPDVLPIYNSPKPPP
jgi:6-phosphogluconolactonase